MPPWMVVGLLTLQVGFASADVVLLDEYWTPEIVVNDVKVTEIDTQQTGDPKQAKVGECSVLLENETGWPNVRFRNGAALRLTEVPTGESDAKLWYRTDTWTGKWTLEVWAYRYQVTDRPVNVLQAELDGGGGDGRLIADDEWHEARGVLAKSDEYDLVPADKRVITFIWLRPTDGWGVPHHTYVDHVEIDALIDEKPPIEPTLYVRPKPGAQVAGDDWVWWEAEDAVEHTFPPGGALLPHNVEEQAVLSNGAWLQFHGNEGQTAKWEPSAPQAGSYTLWCRGVVFEEPFRWRFGGQPWQSWAGDQEPVDVRVVRGTDDEWELTDGWYRLGQVDLPQGKQTFEMETSPGLLSLGLDCFLLTRREFEPDGAKKPADG
ncbi:MAG: hypothetical protein FJX75_03995 [Armatimonadetes bacterium]|nr:hypothetical protein [Armatimonadota bacterium]